MVLLLKYRMYCDAFAKVRTAQGMTICRIRSPKERLPSECIPILGQDMEMHTEEIDQHDTEPERRNGEYLHNRTCW